MLAFAVIVVAAAEMGNPVGRVVNLLRDMQSKLTEEKKADEELYDKMACFCSTNEGEKSTAVEVAEQRIAALSDAIDAGVAKSAELRSLLEKLAKDIAKSQGALQKASGMREKEAGEFASDEAELEASLDSVSQAVQALSKHNFLQSLLQTEVSSRLLKGAAALGAKQHALVKAYLQQPADFQSYNSRSGAIFGILSQMKDTFAANLKAARSDEGRALEQFAALARAKNAEIAAAKAMTTDKTAELAETDENLANDRHDQELTEKSLSKDQQFLRNLKKRCSNQDAEFAARNKARGEEIAAVGDAIGILTDDASRDLFSSTLAFLQRTAVHRTASAVQTRLDGFQNVKKAINKMEGDLKEQMGDESGHRDFCVKELRKNENEQKDKEGEIEDLTATIADHTATIDTLTKEVAELQAAVEEMTRQIKHASEDREAENKEFQQVIADQRATQVILQKAADRLKQTYSAKSLLQVHRADPGGFKKYEQHSGGGSVIGLIEEVIHETAALEAEAIHDEQDAQNAYTGFLADTSASVAANRQSITAKSGEKAGRESALVDAEQSLRAAEATLIQLKKYSAELHASCDFVMQNFDARQDARANELDSLKNALAILSGA